MPSGADSSHRAHCITFRAERAHGSACPGGSRTGHMQEAGINQAKGSSQRKAGHIKVIREEPEEPDGLDDAVRRKGSWGPRSRGLGDRASSPCSLEELLSWPRGDSVFTAIASFQTHFVV